MASETGQGETAPEGVGGELERLRQRLGLASGPAPRIGGRYELTRALGHGAMGEVHLAHDHRLGRTVALKLVRTGGAIDTATLRVRLEREALALARVDHPNVVRVFDVGSHEGQTFFTMQFVPGATLRGWQAGKPRREILTAYLQAARGLAAAHAVNVVHRDFKPDNAIVGDDGVVRVLDFGIAAALRAEDGLDTGQTEVTDEVDEAATPGAETSIGHGQASLSTMTRPGVLLGTLPYMASEQLAGRRADARSDQYAFCVALWEALAGQRPFPGRSPDLLLRGIAAGPAPGGVTPRWLRAILVRGLAEDPRRRWPDMQALVAAIEGARRIERLWRVTLAIAAAAVAVAAGVWGYGVVVRAAAEARADARLAVLRAQLVELDGRGDHAGAAQLLRSFVELADNRDTAALARAQLAWGDAQTDDDAAVDAYASAYMAARTATDEHAALRGLVLRLYARGTLKESSAALAVLLREDPSAVDDPTLARVRLAAALDRRDIATAKAELARGPEAERAWIPVLDELSWVTGHARERLNMDRDDYLVLRAADVDGDGRTEIITNSYGPQRNVSAILRAEPSLEVWGTIRWPEKVTDAILLPHALTGGTMVMSAHPDGMQSRLQLSRVLDGGGIEAVASWQEHGESRSFSGEAVDLDGDGVLELYVGNGPYARRLTRLDRGPDGWTRHTANRATDAARSDMLTLASGDLDGDGRGELVVAPGPWTAYDLRVLRARADARPDRDDTLELVARRTFGPIVQVALPRTRTGRRIAFVKNEASIAPNRFPADKPTGEPGGLYVAELRGDSLEVTDYVPVPREPGKRLAFDKVLAGDLDGDGEDELVGFLNRGDMALLRWHEGRMLPPLVLTDVIPGLVRDVDGDGRDEIVGIDKVRDQIVVFGAGDERLAAVPVVDGARPVPAAISDPAAIAAWRRADELAGIGVPRRTADELVNFARLSGLAAEDLLLRAAELYESTGAHAQAAVNFIAAARRPALAEAALAGAIRSRRRLAEYAAAAELATTRRDLPGLTDVERAAMEGERAALRRAVAPRPELRIDFADALDPMWRIADPLAVQRDPQRRALALWSTRTPVAAEFPLEWDGGPVSIEVDLEIDRIESSNEILIGLAGPDAATPWLAVGVAAHGSSQAPKLWTRWVVGGRSVQDRVEVFAGSRLRMHITVVPELGAVIEDLDVDGVQQRWIDQMVAQWVPLPGAGPLRLVIGGAETMWTEFTGRAWLREVRLTGVTAGARIDTGAPAARMLAELEFVAAEAALREVSGGPELLWRAEALVGLGRMDEAARVIAAVPEDSPEFAELIHRVRRERDPFTLAARAGLGLGWVDVVGRAGGQPRPVDELAALSDWPTLRGPPSADAPPQERARHVWALVLRGRAELGFGHIAAAERDLGDALAGLVDPAMPDRELLRGIVAEVQVRVAAARGDRGALRSALGRVLADSPSPDIKLEVWALDPAVAAVLAPEDWAALRRAHRPR